MELQEKQISRITAAGAAHKQHLGRGFKKLLSWAQELPLKKCFMPEYQAGSERELLHVAPNDI